MPIARTCANGYCDGWISMATSGEMPSRYRRSGLDLLGRLNYAESYSRFSRASGFIEGAVSWHCPPTISN
jgi:hypothetical protein